MIIPRRSRLSRACWIAFAVLGSSGCFATRTRTVQRLDPALGSDGMIGKHVMLVTERGPVGLTLDSLRYPYLMGNATSHGGVAQVRIDQYDRYDVVALNDSGRITSRRKLRSADVLSDPSVLVGNSVMFTSNTARIVLRNVTRIDSPWAEGQLVSGDGPIRVDLRDGHRLDVSDTNWGKSLAYTALGVAAAALVLFLMFMSEDLGTG